MDIHYTQLNDSSPNIKCIDDTSISIIREYLNNWDNDRLRSHQDAFFTQIELNKYLMQVFDRTSRLEYILGLAQKDYSGQITALNMLPDELSKKNASCLEFAGRVERLAKEEYDKFNELSSKYHKDDRYKNDTSVRTSMKGFFGVGTKSRYEAMTYNGNISPCLYWTMCKFAEAILTHEQILSDNSRNHFLEISDIEECIEQVSLERLKELLNKLNEHIVVSGGSRRHTRRHRRHHSKHYHKSVKRSKKSKKIMKSHTRKRHTHARKQNKRRNRSRK